MSAIHATGLSKIYDRRLRRGGIVALAGVDLQVSAGTAFGLIGPNGAGKTTFIKILLGIVRPTGGTVELLGGSPEDPGVRARIGYLPERLHLPPFFDALGVLASVCRLKGVALDARENLALLGRVGLASAARRRVGGYSKGMRQRLGLASALLGRPELLVLDEPTDGIDPLGRVEIRGILQEELARGATLFLNSHLLSETERICDQVAVLAEGRLRACGTLATLRASVEGYQVRFAEGARAASLEQAGFTPGAEGAWRFPAPDPEAFNRALDGARRGGALVVEVSRAARDLEGLLADAVREAA